MTAATDPLHAASAAEPRRLSLGARIFIAFSALFAAGIGVAAGVTYVRGNAVAEAAVSRELANIRDVQQGVEAQRFRQLELIAELFAADPYFSSYVAEATGSGLGFGDPVDTASITDQLAERRAALGFDFALVLDSAGLVIAGTGAIDAANEDMQADPLIGPVVEELLPVSGYWFRPEGAFQVAAVPLAEQDFLVGFLVAGYVVDRNFVEEIRRISGSEMVLLQRRDANLEVVASTLPEDLTRDLLAQAPQLAPGPEPLRLAIGSRNWLALASLKGAGDEGLAVALTSVDAAFAPFRAIENILLLTAGIALLLALPISFGLSRKLLGPVQSLAQAAQQAARGDYNQRFEHFGTDEIGRLTYAFDSLLNDLRQKTDMENYLSDLARILPGEGGDAAPEQTRSRLRRMPVRRARAALLGVELRKFVRAAEAIGAQEAFDLFNANLERIAGLAETLGGRVLAVSGQRVLIVFEDDACAVTAVAAAGLLLSDMDAQNDGLATAVVAGETVAGTAEWSARSHENHLGQIIAQLDRLLSEAPANVVLLGREVQTALKAVQPNIEVRAVNGVLQKDKSFYGLERAQAAALAPADAGGDATLVDMRAADRGQTVFKRIVPGAPFGARYEIISELGAGGMGAVYKAHDHELNEVVALKVIKPELFDADGQALELLKSEIRLARKITHPNVLRTHDFGEINGVPFISMEYVHGITLKHLLQQKGHLPLSAGLRVARQLAAGLKAAHAEGVLHRDIKPENIILQQTGNAKLMDFGIAQQTRRGDTGGEGMVVGTPRFSSPEQLQGLATDERTDVYAAGVVMYQMFTGQIPFAGRSLEQLLKQKLEGPPSASASNPALPTTLSDIIARCLAPDRNARPTNADALLQALEALRR